MPNKEEMLSKLKEVIDPEIGLNIVDLGMVRNCEQSPDGSVLVKIALTVKGCPLANTLENDINKILGELPGVKSVTVRMEAMTKDELGALGERLQKLRQEQKAVGKAAGLSAGIDRLDRRGIQNVVAVISGKGGVGKSYVSAMLAVELRRQGYEVGVLDADITGPSIAKIFGLSGKPFADETGVIPKQTPRHGIKVISMNLLLDKPETPVIWRGPIINGVIRQLFTDVNWGDLHFLIVDLPPGTGDAPLTVFQSLPVDSTIVVSTPQDLSMLIVEKSINMARQLNIPIAGLVENMSYLMCPHCGKEVEMFQSSGIEEKADKLKLAFLGKLPFDPKMNRLADKGRIEDYSSEAIREFVRRARLQMSALSGVKTSPIAWKKSPGEEQPAVATVG